MNNKNALQLLVALSFYGERAIIGEKNNNKIVEMFKKSKNAWVKNDEVAWCAAFVNSVLETCALPQTGKLNARSFLELGQKTNQPIIGDLAVFWRNSPQSVFGHVGFFIKELNNKIYVLGGNQDNEINIKAYPKDQLLEYRTLIIE